MAATTPVAFVIVAGVTIPTSAGTTKRHPGVAYRFSATADPTVDNDSSNGYAVGDMWVNTSSGKVLVASGVGVGAASWKDLSTDTNGAPVDATYYTQTANGTLTNEVVASSQGNAFVANGLLYLKDAAGTPHYWRVDVSVLGVITTVDVGTTVP